MTHGSEIIYLIGTDVGNDGNEIGGIAKISVVEEEFDTCFMTVFINVVDTTCIKR